MADLLLPVLVLAAWVHGAREALPRLWLRSLVGWAVAASLVLTVASFRGYVRGAPQSWVFVNRYLGFFVLLAYAAGSAWLLRRGGDVVLRHFVGAFLVFLWVSCAGSIVMFTLVHSGVVVNPDPWRPFAARGLMDNVNAFGVALVTGIVLHLQGLYTGEPALRRLPALAGLALALVAVWLTGSRATWLAVGVCVGLLAFFRRTRAPLLALAGITVLAVVLVRVLPGPAEPKLYGESAPFARTRATVELAMGVFQGDALLEQQPRIASTLRAIEQWRSEPFLGIGLGVFLARQHLPRAQVMVIHSTPLWLLTELGLVGLALFGIPFLALLGRSLWAWRSPAQPLLAAIGLILLGIGLMSLFHDLMYQRLLWVLLGFAWATLDEAAAQTAP